MIGDEQVLDDETARRLSAAYARAKSVVDEYLDMPEGDVERLGKVRELGRIQAEIDGYLGKPG